jgi:hypothetical protein
MSSKIRGEKDLYKILDFDYFKDTPKDENKVYDNQIRCASDILIHFSKGVNYVTLLAEPQVGKTGVLTQCCKHLLNTKVTNKLCMDEYKLIVLNGMNDIALKKQTQDRLGNQTKVYFNQDVQKLLKNETHADGTCIENLSNAKIIFAIDESHFGQDQSSSNHKFLKKITGCEGELMDYKKWKNKNVKILTISATSFSECINKLKKDRKFKLKTVTLRPSKKYYGISNFYNDDKIIKSYNLTKYEEVVDFVKKYKDRIDQKKYMIIRLPNKINAVKKRQKRCNNENERNVNNDVDNDVDDVDNDVDNDNDCDDNNLRITVENNIKNAIKDFISKDANPNIYYYTEIKSKGDKNKITTGEQLNKILSIVPNEMSIIFVINKLRAGVSLNNTNNISLIHDNPLRSDVAAQSLCGRCCGNNKNIDILIFTNLNLIKQYVDWVDEKFDYQDIPSSGKNVKAKNISSGKEFFSVEKNDETVKRLQKEESREEIKEERDVHKEHETKEMADQRDRADQDNFRENLLDRYGNCIITKKSMHEILQACHVISHNICKEHYKEKEYDINNGIILDCNMHKLFDNFLFSINPETRCVEIGKKLKMNKNEYNQYDGMMIESLNFETLKNLKHHYYVFKKYEEDDNKKFTPDALILESLKNEELNTKDKKSKVSKSTVSKSNVPTSIKKNKDDKKEKPIKSQKNKS